MSNKSYIAIIDGNSMVRTIFESKYRWFMNEGTDLKYFNLPKYVSAFMHDQITGGVLRGKPSAVCLVFDTDVNYRKCVMPSYKANRTASATHKFLKEMTFEDFGKSDFSMRKLMQIKKTNEGMYDLMKQTSDEIRKDKTYKSKKLDLSDEVTQKIENFVEMWNGMIEEINEVKQEEQDKMNAKKEFFNEQLKLLKQTLRDEGIHFMEQSGFEGDDLINSIIKQHPDNKYMIFSGDKDLNQLVSEDVARSTIEVKQDEKGRYRTTIVSLKDVSDNTLLEKVLCGDASDNIPGVPGFGAEKGKELLKLGNTLDEILANDDLSDKDRESILDNYKDLIIYENIITLKNIPVDAKLNKTAGIEAFIAKYTESRL